MLKKFLASCSGNKNGSSNIYMNGKEIYKIYQGQNLVYDVYNGRDFNYEYNYRNQKFTFTDWKQTFNEISNTTHMIVPDDNAIVFDKNIATKYRTLLTDFVLPYNVSLVNGSINGIFHGAANIRNVSIDSYNLTNMGYAFYVSNFPGPAFSGPNVTDMSYAYCGCYKLTGNPVCGPSVTNMAQTYSSCNKLTGSPVCGNNVTSMQGTYDNCQNLTGSPVCGPNVTTMSSTYNNCRNLTGNPVCGDKVTVLYNTYMECVNLTGSPVCGNLVNLMTYAYYNCRNLTGTPVCGPNVTNMYRTYYNCRNLTGNAYFDSNKVSNAHYCFYGHNSSKRLDLYIYQKGYNSTHNTMQSFLSSGNYTLGSGSIRNEVANNGYYNAIESYSQGGVTPHVNVYVHPVDGSPATNDMNIARQEQNALVRYAIRNHGSVPGNAANITVNSGYAYTTTQRNVPGYGIRYAIYSEDPLNYIAFNNSYDLYKIEYIDSTNLTSMYKFCERCYNMVGQPMCGPNVTNMASAYSSCYYLTGSPVCGNNVINMADTYLGCWNITGSPVCGNNVINMYQAYSSCYNITGSPVCGPNVTTMSGTYQNCRNLTGSPVCGDNVTIMYDTYRGCSNLTGRPVCGENVTILSYAYYNCLNLTGSPACGENVINMVYAYKDCCNLTGCVKVGSNVTNMLNAYMDSGCINHKSNAYILSNKINNARGCFGGKDASKTFRVYVPLTGFNDTHNTHKTFINNTYGILDINTSSTYDIRWTNDMTRNSCYYNTKYNTYIYPVSNVANVYRENELRYVSYDTTNTNKRPSSVRTLTNGYTAEVNNSIVSLYKNDDNDTITYISFYNDKNITKLLYMTDDVTSMADAFYNCSNLISAPVCGDKVVNMYQAYINCYSLTGSPVCGPNVTSMSSTYRGCSNLTGSPVCSNNVTDMRYAYHGCTKLTGSPVCGPNVTNMARTYFNCRNLTGNPVCGNNVTVMNEAYVNCKNLTGQPACGPNVTSMYMTYMDCSNLTGQPVCGNLVTDMGYAYTNCHKLIGCPISGPNVINMGRTYSYCSFGINNSLTNGYFYSNKISNVQSCFYGRNYQKRLNLYVPENSTTLNTCLTNNASSLMGETITWTNDITTNGYYYNTQFNTYIYPVANISNVYKENELLIAKYTFKNSSTQFIPKMNTGVNYTYSDYVHNDSTVTRSLYLEEAQVVQYPSMINFQSQTYLLSVEKLKIDNITDATNMFRGCANLTYVPATDWDGSKIIKADYMFTNCTNLTRDSFVKTENGETKQFELSNVESAVGIFDGCTKLS